MSSPYVGEIRAVGFNFAPASWAFCNGAVLAISENDVLFNLIGTTYGGDGQTTFNLPDLQGRIPLHSGSNGSGTYVLGQNGGVETVTVNINQYPAHAHTLSGSPNPGSSSLAAGNIPAQFANAYSTTAPTSSNVMNSAALMSSGGSQPHENLQPYLVINWIISLFGIYPSQS